MTHKNQGGVEVLAILLYKVHIVFRRLPLVHRIEVDTRVVTLDGLEECSECIFEATEVGWSAMEATQRVERTISDRFATVRIPFRSFQPFRRPPWVVTGV